MYLPRLIPLAALCAALCSTADAAGPAREGTILSFECGDNCYLTIRTKGGKELTGLCKASDPCDGWFEEQAMPAAYVGEPVRVTMGRGIQTNAEGQPMGEMEAFTAIEFTRPDFTPPDSDDDEEDDDSVEVPPEVKPFIPAGHEAIAVESADLNGDRNDDYLLVFEAAAAGADEASEGNRTLLLLIDNGKGKLKEAARNDEVVYCRGCGGVYGDPFAGLEVKAKSFTVQNYGGSRERWGYDYQFAYSRRDNAWQLVRVTETTDDTLKPDASRSKIHTPPKDFGKIDLREFKADGWMGQGPR